MIKTKAKDINKKIQEHPEFTASGGWFAKFERRFGIRFLKMCGEKLSAAHKDVYPFKMQLQQKIKDLKLTNDQLYNADESGLFWKLLPEKTLVMFTEKAAPGRKAEKSRITFLACTNATGEHKLKPLVIGRAQNPSRCFKNVSLPVDYSSSKNVWMTSAIFENWFHYSFVPQVTKFLQQKKLEQKAMLLLDNAPSHPPQENLISNDGKIIVMYMPPNVASLIQPMDQNVIRLTKLTYRNSLLSHIFSVENTKTISEAIKALNLRDAVTILYTAWNKVEKQTISKCWKNILSVANDNSDSEDDIPLNILQQNCRNNLETKTVQVTLQLLQAMEPNSTFTAADIIEWNSDKIVIESEESDSELEDERDVTKISNVEAIHFVDNLILWTKQNSVSYHALSYLINIREMVTKLILQEKKVQKTMTDYFTPL